MVGLISWWYGRGWVLQWQRIRERFLNTLEFFSIGQLMATLCAPFRQISAAGGSDGSLGDAMRAGFDKLLSRIIGSIVRTCTILIGLLAIIALTVYELIIMISWWFLPLFPVVGLILFAIGWAPSWI